MTRTQFAQSNGFSSYDELIMSSEIVILDTSTWLVTRTEHGFLALQAEMAHLERLILLNFRTADFS